MDVVYLFKADPENDSEDLRYSLRSLRNLPHDKVVIAGEKPEWARNITYIPVAQTKTKGQNWAMNLYAAAHSNEVSDDFIMMNDDFFIMQPIEHVPDLNFGPMKEVLSMYQTRYPEGTDYISSMQKLYDMLRKRGYAHPISYELHTPMVVNKQKLLDLRAAMKDEPIYQFRSFYGNYFNVGGNPSKDVKIFLDPTHNEPAYNSTPESYLREQVLLSTTGGAFKRGAAGDFIRESFPEKSPYEV